jgi:Arc/MetJ-type ribon-helix-helix transcriptional regulator
MPNQRARGIVNVSFSMPAEMARALDERAKREMTNKSEIVRRAVMAFLPALDADRIRNSHLNDAANPSAPTAKSAFVYPSKKRKV